MLERGATRLVATINSVDVRRWETGVHDIDVKLRVPANLMPGDYRVSLALPDADPGLRARSVYSVQLANVGTWDGDAGVNVVVPRLNVSATSSGEVDLSAMQFVEVP